MQLISSIIEKKKVLELYYYLGETQSANSKRSIRSNWSNKTFKEKAEEVAAPAVGTALVGSLGVVLAKNVLKGK